MIRYMLFQIDILHRIDRKGSTLTGDSSWGTTWREFTVLLSGYMALLRHPQVSSLMALLLVVHCLCLLPSKAYPSALTVYHNATCF